MTDGWRKAPHDVDPLSWYSGPLVPMVFGGLAMTFGTTVTLLASRNGTATFLDWAALSCILLGFLAIGFLTRPRHTAPPHALTIFPVLLGWAGVVLSAFGTLTNTRMPIELWWAPVDLAFLIAAMAPYANAVTLIAAGSSSAVATGIVIAVIPTGRATNWPPLTDSLIGSGPVMVATAAASVFAYQVTRRIAQWAALEPGSALSSGVLGESAKLQILRDELAAVGDRALPLLHKVANSGIVTDDDRERAKQLSDAVRTELVAKANRSWLDTLASRLNLTVLDSEHRADRMNAAQRAALLGLLTAATEGEAKLKSTIVIQLRGEPDGSTAVALSTDVQFPEGRRVTLLAPHFFSLKATVDALEWDSGRQLKMRFRLPPNR